MSEIPSELQYTDDHEYLKSEGADVVVVGITDYAQGELGDVVYVELPAAGAAFTAGDSFGSVESVKAVSELYIPVSGEVVESNASLTDSPETVNTEPHAGGWMVRIKISDPSQLESLMKSDAYEEYVKQEGGE